LDALSLTPGVGSTLFKRLLDQFKTAELVFRARPEELMRVEGVGEKVREPSRRGLLKRLWRGSLLLNKVGGR